MNIDKSFRKETDFYIRFSPDRFGETEIITFKHPAPADYEKRKHDWQIIVVLEKADKVKTDRHLLTMDLLLEYRWAIREGFGHQLDPHLQNQFDHPRNKNTIQGIKSYIYRIKKLSDEEMKSLDNDL